MTSSPSSSGSDRRVELTLRGLILGFAITLVFTAANVYLGLKVGLTFASSIPAAVISMAILRWFKGATIYENNIVQTVASAAGTLSSIIFVLPGLIMIGWWNGFPFWESFWICVVGGILGVMYTIPLRRALVTQSDLPYPEGVAAAEVLRVGTGSREGAAEGAAGLLAVVVGAIASAAFQVVAAMRLFTSEIDAYFRAGNASTGIGIGLSFALLGAGHLIGIAVGSAILVGLLLSWGVLVPLLTAMHPAAGTPADVAVAVWATQVRFIGAGTIGAAAIWTLLRLAAPVWNGLRSTIAAARDAARVGAGAVPRTERDLPIGVVVGITGACIVPMIVLLLNFLHGQGSALAAWTVPLTVVSVVYVVVIGFFVAAVCGYMAGLIGSSNSPVSGLAILAVLGISLLVLLIARASGNSATQTMIAFALFVTAIVLNVATIANDNLQDLKTGQLVDATPWRQQVALIVGVVAGALVIPPVLDLLNGAYGFPGAHAHAPAGSQPLPAPQATLISQLAQGVIGGNVPWNLIGIGALIGAVVIVADEILRTRKLKLPPLAVGLGVYLPAATTVLAVVGAFAGWFYNRWAAQQANPEATKRMGVLLACGLIVGESLFGVALAGIIVATDKASPLAVVGSWFAVPANVLGGLAFAGLAYGLYAWVGRLGRRCA